MEEIFNFIIEVANYLRYGHFANRNRSFEKELSNSIYITDFNAEVPRVIASKQLSDLLKKGKGTPTFAYYKKKKQDWYDVFILNEEKKLFCRLNVTQIPKGNLPDSFYLFL